MSDAFRHKITELRQYSFNKRQTKNYTGERLDYFLINDDSMDMVKIRTLSEHRPIYLTLPYQTFRRVENF